MANNLGVELHFMPKAGHLNAESGYTTFKALLGEVKSNR
ncbi:MAG: hypothetical protein ACR2LN_03320 [Candidatus Levyibacteriota bacterium]